MRSSLDILEYDKLKKIIEKHIQTDYGKRELNELHPVFDIDKAEKDFGRLNEFFHFFYKWGSIVLDDICISNIVKDAFSGILIEKELFQIGNFLNMLKEIETNFKEHESNLCEKYISFDIPFELFDEINRAIDEHGFMKDSATAYLYNLRNEIKQIKDEIVRSLKNIMHSRVREVVLDTAIFMKRSRYTILMKPNFKEYINGRIIEIAKSGGFFVEPDSVYEINNKLEEIILKEEAERKRILAKITDMVRKCASLLMYNEKRVGMLDLEIAKFNYAKNFEQPEIVFKKYPLLFAKNVKHPILASINTNIKSVDIDLKSDNKLIITGPNTGGKTVFLKTAGLLVLSIFSNIPPIGVSIEIGNFSNVFAIIGDEQDIFESLSSFSAKMVAFKKIYDLIDKNSLVLLDEIGGGTSPDEGEAVAFSIIKNLTDKCVFIATTHYKRLAHILASKHYPVAAFEFDKKNLKPTYKLKYFQVGQSYATEILKTLHLPDDVVNVAIEFYKNNETNFSKLEKELEIRLKELDKKIRESEETKKRYEVMFDNIKTESRKMRVSFEKDMEVKQRRYEEIMLKLKNEINILLKEKNVSKTHKLLNNITKETKELFLKSENAKNVKNFTIGEWVKFGSMVGKIADIKGNRAYVEINGKVVKVEMHMLQKEKNRKGNNRTLVRTINVSEKFEINIIGKRRDDAEIELLKFLDSSIMSSVKTVRIVHGIGSGILKSMVYEILKNHPYVKSFHAAHPNEGGDGATIAEFK